MFFMHSFPTERTLKCLFTTDSILCSNVYVAWTDSVVVLPYLIMKTAEELSLVYFSYILSTRAFCGSQAALSPLLLLVA